MCHSEFEMCGWYEEKFGVYCYTSLFFVFFVYSIVYKHLKQPDETKKESCVGIQLMGVVLSAKFPPYAPTAPVDQEK